MASTGFRNGSSPGQTRAATAPACEACRKLKMKCTRAEPQGGGDTLREPCERCIKTNRACKIPDSRPLGRKRGALGRYQGFEKAYRKLQSEAKKAKFSRRIDDIYEAGHLPVDEEPTLESLLSYESADPSRFSSTTDDPFLGPPVSTPGETVTQVNHEEEHQSQLNQEPISNPLALLAYASDAAQTSEASPVSTDNLPTLDSQASIRESQACCETKESEGYRLLHRPGYVSLGLQLSRASLVQGLDNLLAPVDCEYQSLDYFKKRARAHQRDVGPDLDPIDLKLVTMDEVNYLFPMYFARLHPVNGILDPMLHTPDFVRSQSSLLFTWILAITSQFDHASASIAERLRLHGEKLSRYVHTCGYKSVEIVQGYYISLLSNTPAKALTEERSWLYTMYAFGVAMELGLDQESASHRYTRVPHSFRGSRAQQCQNMPSFNSSPAEASSQSVHGPLTDHTAYEERLARNRERTWLRILLWERANSAACGRIHSFPETNLTRAIDTWWLHPLADMTDKYTSAFIILRKSLASLQAELKHQERFTHSDPHWVRELVDSALQNWCNTWLPQPRSNTPTLLPEQLSIIFLRHVYVHGRLWTLSLALSGSVARAQDLDAIRQDCFESAVNCCETAVRDLQVVGESLYCMLAPTWAMISYAAVLTLRLFPALYGPRIGIEVELLALLSQVALQLQRAGTTPSHRFGIAALLGQHLMMILRARAVNLKEPSRASERQLGPSHDHRHHISQGLPEWQVAMPQITPRNPLVSDWDPFLTPAMSDQDGFSDEGFADLFREIFGPGFGGFF